MKFRVAIEPPQMTTAERDALTPVEGMLIYNLTIDKLQTYENSTWVDVRTVSGSGNVNMARKVSYFGGR